MLTKTVTTVIVRWRIQGDDLRTRDLAPQFIEHLPGSIGLLDDPLDRRDQTLIGLWITFFEQTLSNSGVVANCAERLCQLVNSLNEISRSGRFGGRQAGG